MFQPGNSWKTNISRIKFMRQKIHFFVGNEFSDLKENLWYDIPASTKMGIENLRGIFLAHLQYSFQSRTQHCSRAVESVPKPYTLKTLVSGVIMVKVVSYLNFNGTGSVICFYTRTFHQIPLATMLDYIRKSLFLFHRCVTTIHIA